MGGSIGIPYAEGTISPAGSVSEDACVSIPASDNLPVMNRWGLLLLIGCIITAAMFLFRRQGVFEK